MFLKVDNVGAGRMWVTDLAMQYTSILNCQWYVVCHNLNKTIHMNSRIITRPTTGLGFRLSTAPLQFLSDL